MKTFLSILFFTLLSNPAHAQYVPLTQPPLSISTCHTAIDDDFVAPSGAAGKYQVTGTVSGGSATNSAGSQGHLGIVTYSTGPGTTGNAASFLNGGFTPFRFDSATFVAEWVIKIPTASDGTDTFGVGFGIADLDVGVPVPAQTSPSGGVWVRYTSTTNSGKFEFCTSNGGPAGTVCTDTGVALDTANYHRWTIQVVQNGNANAYYDGALVKTASTNIPTTQGANMNWRINKSAGTNPRTYIVDAYSLYYCYGTPR
jgi:hypothetical protein